MSLSNNTMMTESSANAVDVNPPTTKGSVLAEYFELTGWTKHSLGAGILSALQDTIGSCVLISDETLKLSSSALTPDT